MLFKFDRLTLSANIFSVQFTEIQNINLPRVIEHQSHDFSHTFTVNFAAYAPRWRPRPWNLLLFAVREINKIGIGLSQFRVWYLTILKRKSLSLPLKDETDQFVICLVLPECLSFKIAFYPRTVSESWQCWSCDAEFPFPLFFSSSASFKL